ncbi:unnamed protein product, partial [Dovyalis caffra]
MEQLSGGGDWRETSSTIDRKCSLESTAYSCMSWLGEQPRGDSLTVSKETNCGYLVTDTDN